VAIRELVEKHKAKAANAEAAEAATPEGENQGAAAVAGEKKAKAPKELVFEGGDQEDIKQLDTDTSFAQLGVCPEICDAIEKMGFENPSKI